MPTRRITLAFNDGFSRSVLADVDGQLAVCQAGYGYDWTVTHVSSMLRIVRADSESNARLARAALQKLPIEWERKDFANSISENERALFVPCVLKLIQEQVVLPMPFRTPPGAARCWQFHGGEVADAVCLLPVGHEGPHQWQPEVSPAVVDLSPDALEVVG